jgi:hypothetical protein
MNCTTLCSCVARSVLGRRHHGKRACSSRNLDTLLGQLVRHNFSVRSAPVLSPFLHVVAMELDKTTSKGRPRQGSDSIDAKNIQNKRGLD